MHTCEFITKYKDVFNGKTILQDNVRFHHARRVKSYTTSNNIKMEYIPAYSPIFNPIEMVFSKVKSVYRKLEHTNIVEDIKHAISKVTSTDTANCYAHTVKTINEYAEK